MSIFLFLLFPFFSFAQSGPVFWMEIKGAIDPGSASYLLSAIEKADAQNAEALILQLDTPGGLLSSTRDIIQKIATAKTPFIIFVSPSGASATSAGALISMAAPVVAMSPGTNIGAAHPVGPSGEDIKGNMAEKVTNDTAALARSQAVLHDRDPKVAAEIVEKSKSFSAEEAVGKVADFLANNPEDLLKKLQGRKVKTGTGIKTIQFSDFPNVAYQKIEMNFQQKFLHTIAHPNISTALLALGGLALYIEVSGGFSAVLPGVFGLFCVILGAMSLQMLPINLGGILLFLLGVALLIGEAFVFSHGFLTVSGLLSIFMGAIFLIDPSSSEMRVSMNLMIPFLAGVGCVMLIVVSVLRKQSVMHHPDPLLGVHGKVQSIEADGMSGMILVNGELWKFHAHEKVAEQDECKVVSRKSMILKIERKS